MNGWINDKRSDPAKGRWRIVLDLGPKPGSKARKQKWLTFRGTRKDAAKHLRNLLSAADRGEFVTPSKQTVGEWLGHWLLRVKATRSARTYQAYRNAVEKHMQPSELGGLRLQGLTPSDVERYHHAKAGQLSHATLQLHQAVLSAALKLAARDGHVQRNVAPLATERPRGQALPRVLPAWTAEEAAAVLAAARASQSAQCAAFFALALDSGARKGELQGLRWSDVDLTTGVLRIERQLLREGLCPVFGPTKTRKSRTLDLSEETLALLREHKREQAELKLANRLHYADHGLVFAQQWEQKGSCAWQLGAPLGASVFARMMRRICSETAVRRITVHGLRHTSATLLLAAGVQPHVVQKRLGHSNIGMTLGLYAHVLPGQQADAAKQLAALLYR